MIELKCINWLKSKAIDIDRIHALKRFQLPMNIISEIAPIVQKFVDCAVVPKIIPRANPMLATNNPIGMSSTKTPLLLSKIV